MGEMGRFTFIRRLGITKESGISQFRFMKLICDDLATSCKHLVTFGPVTAEFKGDKDVHPLLDHQSAAPLLNIAGISTEFSGAITNFCFIYSLEASLLCRAATR